MVPHHWGFANSTADLDYTPKVVEDILEIDSPEKGTLSTDDCRNSKSVESPKVKRPRVSKKQVIEVVDEKEDLLKKSRGGLTGGYWVNLGAGKRRSQSKHPELEDFDRPKKKLRIKDIYDYDDISTGIFESIVEHFCRSRRQL